MEMVAVVAGLALFQYLVFSGLAGAARARYAVAAPAVTGHPVFERAYRIQQNTLEQLMLFLPSLGLFAWFLRPDWAAVLGIVYLLGRTVYARAYWRDPSSRGPGFLLTLLPSLILLLGGTGAAAWHWLAS